MINPKKRFMILERDGFTCQYCGATPPKAKLEVDHIIPVSKGGNDSYINLITACQDCNRGKGGTPLWRYPQAYGDRERDMIKLYLKWEHEKEGISGDDGGDWIFWLTGIPKQDKDAFYKKVELMREAKLGLRNYYRGSDSND